MRGNRSHLPVGVVFLFYGSRVVRMYFAKVQCVRLSYYLVKSIVVVFMILTTVYKVNGFFLLPLMILINL